MGIEMGEKEEQPSLLSLKDFEERGIKIDPYWTGLEALVAVASLASEKLEEEKIRKEKKEKERKVLENNGCWTRLAAYNGFECGGSSRSFNDSQEPQLARVSDRKERDKSPVRNSLPNLYLKKKQGFDVDFDKSGSAPRSKDKRICLATVPDHKERENALKKPLTNTVSGKKVATRDKLLGDAMKARILPWEDDDDDEEWRAEYEKQKPKLKRNAYRRDNNEEKDPKSNKKLKRPFRYIVPEMPPDLPQNFREKIENLNGSNIKLVIQKSLYSSDISDHQNRLLIPWKQIISMETFLNEEERIHLDKEHTILVKFIEPSLQECEMTLKKRKMDKEKGKSSLSYVLIKQWKDFKNRNDLEVGDTIQLWSFRSAGGELCLAFVLVGRGGQNDEENDRNNNGYLDGANTSEDTGNGGNESTGSTASQASTPAP